MLRSQAKELISFWLYLDRRFANLLEFGDAQSDQCQAEIILRFFEGEERCYKGLEYAQDKDDFRRFRCIFDQITEKEVENVGEGDSEASVG